AVLYLLVRSPAKVSRASVTSANIGSNRSGLGPSGEPFMSIDLSAVNWTYVALMAAFVFV
ncbi:MAG: hypothetical protein WA425_08110, partial [Xanthobacteraceae bacterium]